MVERIDVKQPSNVQLKGQKNANNGMKDGRHCDLCNSWTQNWFVWTMTVMTLVFFILIGYGFGSGLFLPAKNDGGNPKYRSTDRQDYKYDIVTLLDLPLVLEPTSAQARALEWLAFEDEPLFDPATFDPNNQDHYRDVVSQRYALVVWYFDQGGPTVWKTLNREPSSGWIKFGAGIHECDWRGVDCDYGDNASSSGGTVVGLRLLPSLGLLLTGSSLSTELGLLTGLRRLNLSEQRLRGKIPDEWATLTNLGEQTDFEVGNTKR